MTFQTTLRRAFLLLALCFAPLLAHAQMSAADLPDADKQAIKAYTLNDDILDRLVAATREARTLGIQPQAAPDPSKIHTLDDLAAQAMASDPRITPLVRKYGFTPRDFILANIALMNAAMAMQARNDPDLAKNINPVWINAENVRYVETHQDKLQQLSQ